MSYRTVSLHRRSAMFRRLALVGIGWLLITGAPAQPTPDPLHDVLTRLHGTISDVQTIETAFVQEKHLAMLQRVLTIRGNVYLAKPDRLAWHVAAPVRYTMIMDGNAIRQWDAESGRESRMSLDANPALQMATAQMRQWFVGDYLRLQSEYRITLDSQDPVKLTFVPRPDHPAAGYIDHVTVEFTNDERYLAGMTIVEQQGDRTTMRFHDTRLNGTIPDEAWDLRSDIPHE